EGELYSDMLKRNAPEANAEVRREIATLLRNSGFKVTDPGESLVSAEKGPFSIESPTQNGRRPRNPSPPLPTLPYPQVTRLEIVYPDDCLRVAMQDNHSVRIET